MTFFIYPLQLFLVVRLDSCVKCEAGSYTDIAGSVVDCPLCPKGFFAAKQEASSCLPCIPGTISKRDGSKSCSLCLINQYATELKSISCNSCPPGTLAKRQGMAQCQNCSAGRSGSGCLACIEGQYRSAEDTNPLTCDSCPSGYYTEKVGSASCFPCVPGQISQEQASICNGCHENTYAPLEASVNCTNCPSGTSSGNGSAVCQPCSAGRAGTPCDDCIAGKYRGPQDLAAACIDCPLGKYQDLSAQASCLPCFPGSYQQVTGQTSCINCPIDSYAKKKGSKDCSPCKLGEFALVGSGTCSRCELGRYANVAACDADVRRTSILAMATLVLSRNLDACLDCPNGYYGEGKGLLECRTCPSGRYGDKFKALSAADCSACKIGRSSVEASVEISDCVCDVGLYKPTNSPLECLECPKGGDCSVLGATTTTIQSLKGYWRQDLTKITFYECAVAALCPSGFPQNQTLNELLKSKENNDNNNNNNNNNTNQTLDMLKDQCLIGNKGILCGVCEDGYDRIDGICRICTLENVGNKLLVPIIILLLGLVLLVALCKSKFVKKYKFLLKDIRRIVQINISFAQINSSMPSVVEGIVWPKEFRDLLARMNVVNLDFYELSGAGCAARLGYTSKFIGMACLPILTVIFGYVGFHIVTWRADKKMDRMNKEEKEEIEYAALEQAFKMVDRDGSGVVDEREMILLLKEFGWIPPKGMTNEQIEQTAIARLDLDQDGDIEWSLDDFINSIHSGILQKKFINEGKIMDANDILKWSYEEKAQSTMLMMTALMLLILHTP